MDIQRYASKHSFAGLIWARTAKEPEKSGRPIADSDTFDQLEETPLILCRNCHYPITRALERIEVASSHSHTFANPNGYLFEIGCFRHADGCVTTGVQTDEFTWFRGYTWQIGICGKCLNHLGWLFRSTGDYFYGLILDRLTEQ